LRQSRSAGGLRTSLLSGDRRVWRAAGVVAAIGCVILLAALLQPRERLLGSNSVAARGIVAEVPAGGRLCADGQRLPAGTGRVRLRIDTAQRPQPALALDVRTAEGQRLTGRIPAAPAVGYHAVDIPLDGAVRARDGDSARARLCLTASGAVAVRGNEALGPYDEPLRVDGRRIDNRVALWFLPREEERASLLSQAGAIARRAALFRPGFVGPWTYWLLLAVVMPALGYAAVRLTATADAPGVRPRRLVAGVGAIALGVAICWTLVTPAFQVPDESEHAATAQYLAETGDAVSAVPDDRPIWSSDLYAAMEAVREIPTIERAETRAPWLEAYETAYAERERSPPPLRRDDGGGYHEGPSSHTPLYYALLAPAYLSQRGGSVFAQLLAMRWTSALMGALAAALAAATMLELLPGRRGLAAVAGLLVAFQPMFSVVAGGVNNDNGVNLLAALVVYLAVRALRRGLAWPLGLALGAAVAVAPLMKGTGYALYPSVALALAAGVVRFRDRRAVLGLAAVAAAFLAVTGAWELVRGAFDREQFTTPGGSTPGEGLSALEHPVRFAEWVWQILVPVRPPFMTDVTIVKWPFFNIYVERGFGAFGWYAILFPAWVYLAIFAAMAVAGAGAVRLLVVERRAALARWPEIAFLASVPVVVFLAVEAAYFTLAVPLDGTPEQGRYAFTAIVPLAVIAVGGVIGLAGRRRALPAAAGLVTAMAILCLASQLLTLAGFYA
jgi:4-amino-4-deoxy-L-arabinose transferase-like glycosyltransferase